MTTTRDHLPSVRAQQRCNVQALLRDRAAFNRHSYSRDSLPRAANWAKQRAATDSAWESAERAGLVRLDIRFDDGRDWGDLAGDMFSETHADTVPGGMRTIKAQEKAYRDRIEQEGVYGVVGQYRTNPNGAWEDADSCWGFVGDDWKDSGYDEDAKALTLKALREQLRDRCPCCRQCRH